MENCSRNRQYQSVRWGCLPYPLLFGFVINIFSETALSLFVFLETNVPPDDSLVELQHTDEITLFDKVLQNSGSLDQFE